MKIEGSYTFDAPRDVVWTALLDIELLSKAMPGCEELEQVGNNEYAATLNVRVGPVQGRFDGTVTLSDLNPPESYHMKVSGRGAPGFASGEGDIRLQEQGEATVLYYNGNGQVGGRIASVGQRLLDTTAKALIRQGLDEFRQLIEARREAHESGGPVSEIEAPSQMQFAARVARGVLEELIPAERRPAVAAAAILLLAVLVLVLIRIR